MRRKGFTLVELLVVIAIIALLMGILLPALAKVRALAQRVVCGSHLSSIGKAIMLYANEYQGKYPRAGGADSYWGRTTQFNAQPNINNPTEWDAYGMPPSNKATIGASLFYLIKYADASTKTFLCGGDSGVKEFKLTDYSTVSPLVYNNDITEAWDFGGTTSGSSSDKGNPIPAQHYSYAFHYPYGKLGVSYFPISGTSDAGMAIMADRSPYIVLTADPTWEIFTYVAGGNKETDKWGNSANHNKEGQNVLYNDGHTTFEVVPYCGIDSDNIYTMYDTSAGAYKQQGIIPPTVRCFNTLVYPKAKNDSLLLNEGLDQTQKAHTP